MLRDRQSHEGCRRQRNWCRWAWLGLSLTILPCFSRGDSPVSFRNDVMPVLSKAGCNAGMCHGNQNGKAGFKLSLRGEDPAFDFNALTREAFGRRANPLEPVRSLLLVKATAETAHEGGQRFNPESSEYKLLYRWIGSGLQNDLETAPKLTGL